MIHHVFANRSNIGDWLSAKGIQILLGEPVVEHLCDEPFVAQTLTALAGLGFEDVVVVGGGGLFMDYFEPLWRGLADLDLKASLAIWGVGVCDLKLEPSLPRPDVLRSALEKTRLCVVRDALTRDYLGIEARIVACPSLAAIPPAGAGHGLLHVDNYTTASAEVYQRMDAMGRAFADETGRPYRTTNNRIEPGRVSEMNALLTRYAASDVVLSSALHGCIIAVAMGRKVLAVSGDRKIEGFMQAAGLRDWVLELHEVEQTAERLAQLGDQPSAPEYVHAAIADNRAVAEAVRALAPIAAAP